MKLTSAHIRHFKSLDDVQIDFDERVTVLVGPNAAGKSNVVDSLRFLRDAIATDLEHAVSSRGGMSRVRQHSKAKPFKVAMHIEFSQDETGAQSNAAEYSFSVDSFGSGGFVVDQERAVYLNYSANPRNPHKVVFNRNRTGATHQGDGPIFEIASTQTATDRSKATLFGGGSAINKFICQWQFSSIYPNQLRQPSTPEHDAVLSEDGRNWASIIKLLKRSARGRKALDRIGDAMRSVAPTFEEVTISSVGSYLVPHFKFSLNGSERVVFDPVQLSDGTLRIFGILLALYQVPAPRLLVIEEPEQSVQPGIMAVLAEAFAEASEETQIVITTHSPSLIDHFKPEQVRVVTLEDGLSKVSRVKKSQMEAVKRDLMSMQDFMLAEGLQPELP
jgi:predicted ATPase